MGSTVKSKENVQLSLHKVSYGDQCGCSFTVVSNVASVSPVLRGEDRQPGYSLGILANILEFLHSADCWKK